MMEEGAREVIVVAEKFRCKMVEDVGFGDRVFDREGVGNLDTGELCSSVKDMAGGVAIMLGLLDGTFR